jgi:hypothetical protein
MPTQAATRISAVSGIQKNAAKQNTIGIQKNI